MHNIWTLWQSAYTVYKGLLRKRERHWLRIIYFAFDERGTCENIKIVSSSLCGLCPSLCEAGLWFVFWAAGTTTRLILIVYPHNDCAIKKSLFKEAGLLDCKLMHLSVSLLQMWTELGGFMLCWKLVGNRLIIIMHPERTMEASSTWKFKRHIQSCWWWWWWWWCVCVCVYESKKRIALYCIIQYCH